MIKFSLEEWKQGENWTVDRLALAFEDFVRNGGHLEKVQEMVLEVTRERLMEQQSAFKQLKQSGIDEDGELPSVPVYPDREGVHWPKDLMDLSSNPSRGEALYILSAMHLWCCSESAGEYQIPSTPLVDVEDLMKTGYGDFEAMIAGIGQATSFGVVKRDYTSLVPYLVRLLNRVTAALGSRQIDAPAQELADVKRQADGAASKSRGRPALSDQAKTERCRIWRCWLEYKGNGTKQEFLKQHNRSHDSNHDIVYLNKCYRTWYRDTYGK